MKYDVTFSCGHTAQVDLAGKVDDRYARIEYWQENGLCPACYREKKKAEDAGKYDEIRMAYREYKERFPSFKTKWGSYDAKEKTIIVLVPKDGDAEETAHTPKIFRNTHIHL